MTREYWQNTTGLNQGINGQVYGEWLSDFFPRGSDVISNPIAILVLGYAMDTIVSMVMLII